MKVILVGYKDTRFENLNSHEIIEGQTIYFEYEQDKVHGVATDRAFLPVSKRIVPAPSVPCTASIFYNKYGKIDEVVITS